MSTRKCMNICLTLVIVVFSHSLVFAQAHAGERLNIGLTDGIRNRVTEIMSQLSKEKLNNVLIKIDRKIVQLARDTGNPGTARRLIIQLWEIRTMVQQKISRSE